MKKNVLNSPRLLELKRQRRRAVWGKFFILFFGVLIIFASSAYLSRLSNLNISEIKISGNNVVETEALETAIDEQLAGKYLWLFPKTNVLYYPEKTIKTELSNKFSRLKDINLSVMDRKILEVSVSEREAKYTWCGATPDETTQKCYFLDDVGYIFDEAPYFSGNVYFKFYGAAELGAYFYQQNFEQLISFKDNLVDFGLKPVALYVKANGDAEMFLANGASVSKPKILFKTDADLANVAENLDAALTTEPLKSKFKTRYASLEYIDLRFGNKVYDKFR